MADNETGRLDEDGDRPDWIEIFNPDSTPVSLAGYYLTDNQQNLTKWRFPAVTLQPGAFLVVFASGKNRVDPSKNLHTSFDLLAAGEYLALVAPNGSTVLNAFAPTFPPQFENVSYGYSGASQTPVLSFFTPSTPGATNTAGTRAGPVVKATVENPSQPDVGALTITASARAVNAPVATMRMYYRKGYGAETLVNMTDDGSNGDATAGDGIWTGIIPATALGAGEMTRWRFVGLDTEGTQTREPAFRTSLDSHQYFGTVAKDSRIRTLLPVLHWYTSNPAGANDTTGSRGSVYYDGEFYDNVLFNVHGQSTAGFPKHSYNIDFNKTQRFRWSTNSSYPRVADIDLLTNWADKSKVRHVLGYEVMREAGVAAHFAYTIRVQQNGVFFSTADFVEDADERYLERAGLNPDGALYKVYANVLNKAAGNTATSGVEKKTRQFEANSDLQAVIDGLALTGTNLTRYLYDNIDIPACVNMLAANSVIRNIDMHSKNWYMYRDTGRSGEWRILPWDLDLSHGRVWNSQNTYFDSGLYVDGYVTTGESIRLVQVLLQNPQMRSMLMRRIRTLSDRFLQPPPAASTPEEALFYERRLNEQLALIDPPSIVPSDAQQDFQKWGSWLQPGTVVSYANTNVQVETMAEAVARFKTAYLPGRRNYIYNTQVVGRGGEIPLPQAVTGTFTYWPLVQAGASVKAFVPQTNILGANWIGVAGNEPYDTSSWLSGLTGVGYERDTGYQSLIGLNVNSNMLSNNSIYMRVEFDVPSLPAFDRLELRMKFDDGFVAYLNGTFLVASNAPASPQWNSAAIALHEANAATFDVFDITSKRTALKAGRNVLAIQGLNDSTTSSDMIFVPELYIGVLNAATAQQPRINFGTIEASPASGIQDSEFIQMVNPNSIAVDISDWKVTGGIDHTFPGGTVIPANGSMYITPSAAAFRARTTGPRGGQGLLVQGGYDGHLSSFGETVWLVDSSGATNATATYPGAPSDAQKYLVVSEVMYRPAGDGLAEYIELLNISTNVTIDLADVRFTQGVEFNFRGSAVTLLPPGRRALVVRDISAFGSLYGFALPVAGVFTNGTALSNDGERVKLEDAGNQTIQDFAYQIATPWPLGASGTGYSIVLIAPETHPDPALPENWRVSAGLGNPGFSDALPLPQNPFGDSNGNGQTDLADYAFGTNLGDPIPTTVTVLPDVFGGPTNYRISYPVSVGAELAKVELLYSTNLVNWLPAGTNFVAETSQRLIDGRAILNWRSQPPLREQNELFLKLQVTQR